jgi:hypothetical protein
VDGHGDGSLAGRLGVEGQPGAVDGVWEVLALSRGK